MGRDISRSREQRSMLGQKCCSRPSCCGSAKPSPNKTSSDRTQDGARHLCELEAMVESMSTVRTTPSAVMKTYRHVLHVSARLIQTKEMLLTPFDDTSLVRSQLRMNTDVLDGTLFDYHNSRLKLSLRHATVLKCGFSAAERYSKFAQ